MNQPEGVIAKDKKQDVQTSEVIVWTKNRHLNNDPKSLTNLLHNLDSLSMNMTSASILKNFNNEYIIFCLYIDDILILELLLMPTKE